MKIVLDIKKEDLDAMQAIADRTGETLEQVAYRIGIRNITDSYNDRLGALAAATTTRALRAN